MEKKKIGQRSHYFERVSTQKLHIIKTHAKPFFLEDRKDVLKLGVLLRNYIKKSNVEKKANGIKNCVKKRRRWRRAGDGSIKMQESCSENKEMSNGYLKGRKNAKNTI